MELTIQIKVNDCRAVLEQMPFIIEGTRGDVLIAVTFDEGWDGFADRHILLSRGEEVLRLELDSENRTSVPQAFMTTEEPFCLCVTGESGETFRRTNDLTAAFRRAATDGGETVIPVYTGPYTLTENATYPLAGNLLTKDLTVAVRGVLTDGDTVTPETLLQGVTAHDADGNPIVGTYVNPYNANTASDTVTPETLLGGVTAHNAAGEPIVGTLSLGSAAFNVTYSETEPEDTSKLWVQTSVRPVREICDYITPEWTAADGEYNPISGGQHFEGLDGELCYYHNLSTDSGYTPQITVVKPDGTCHVLTVGDTAATAYDWEALNACAGNGYYYVLLCSAKSATANRRAPRLLSYHVETGVSTLTTLVQDAAYYAVFGYGICVGDNGAVYFFIRSKNASSEDYTARFYRHENGVTTQLGEDIACADCGYGTSGMECVDGTVYCITSNSSGSAFCIDTETDTVGRWQIDGNIRGETLLIGKENGLLKLRFLYGLWYIDLATGKAHEVHIHPGYNVGSISTTCATQIYAWRYDGDEVFLLSRNYADSVVQYTRLPRQISTATARYLRGLENTYLDPVGTDLPLIASENLHVNTPVCEVYVTDGVNGWQPAVLYQYEDEETGWSAVL